MKEDLKVIKEFLQLNGRAIRNKQEAEWNKHQKSLIDRILLAKPELKKVIKKFFALSKKIHKISIEKEEAENILKKNDLHVRVNYETHKDEVQIYNWQAQRAFAEDLDKQIVDLQNKVLLEGITPEIKDALKKLI